MVHLCFRTSITARAGKKNSKTLEGSSFLFLAVERVVYIVSQISISKLMTQLQPNMELPVWDDFTRHCAINQSRKPQLRVYHTISWCLRRLPTISTVTNECLIGLIESEMITELLKEQLQYGQRLMIVRW